MFKIQRINKLTGNQIIMRKAILVPLKPDAKLPDPEESALLSESLRKKKHRQEFRNVTGCSAEETEFYLEDAEYDLPEAIERWKEDREWERYNQDPKQSQPQAPPPQLSVVRNAKYTSSQRRQEMKKLWTKNAKNQDKDDASSNNFELHNEL